MRLRVIADQGIEHTYGDPAAWGCRSDEPSNRCSMLTVFHMIIAVALAVVVRAFFNSIQYLS